MTEDNSNKQPTKWIVLIIIIGVISIAILPWLFTRTSIFANFNSDTGAVGDTINGISSPFLGIGVAIITFMAFWVQYQFNTKQNNQFIRQVKDTAIQRFENKLFTLIELHRKNVDEMRIGKSLSGRRAFISMFNELKFLTIFTEQFSNNYNGKGGLSKSEEGGKLCYNISYLIFFFGIGKNSTPIILDLIDKKYSEFLLALESNLYKVQHELKHRKKVTLEYINSAEVKTSMSLELTYIPFNGHMSRISHYIRQLFQTVKFIDEQDPNIIDDVAKYDYAATIRAQLSLHEQLMVYYNSLSVLGEPWLSPKNLLEHYCLIKSIPLPLTDFGISPNGFLKEHNHLNKPMFEWSDIKKRLGKNEQHAVTR